MSPQPYRKKLLMTNVSEFRKALHPATETLKAQADRLKDFYRTKHADYESTGRSIQGLRERPPHRSELKQLLSDWCDDMLAKHRERIRNEVLKPFEIDRFNEDEAKRRTASALEYQFEKNVTALLLPLLKGELDLVVNNLDWPDVLDPAERDRQLAELTATRAALKAELAELRTLGDEVGMDLHRAALN
jgi:hypothetical protein